MNGFVSFAIACIISFVICTTIIVLFARFWYKRLLKQQQYDHRYLVITYDEDGK